jgi:hypothetical protein
MDAPVDVNELLGRIAQQIEQQVQTQMTELEGRIDQHLGQFATTLHHRIDRVLERVETLETRSRKSSSRRHESKKSLVSKNPRVTVSASFCTTPISITQVPSTPGSPAVLSKSNSVLQRTPVTDSSSGEIDIVIKYQFDICLFDILFWPNFDLVSLRKTPAKVSFPPSPVAPVSNIHEAPDEGDSDPELDDFRSSPTVELFPEDKEQELNFIVEGCTFRGDIDIPTPPPSDAEQEDPPRDSNGRPWKDVRVPSPPGELDWYLDESSRRNSFRPVTVPLLPATMKTPPRQTASQKAVTTGAVRAARAVPSSDTVARRLSYSDVSTIRRSHGERDPSRAAVSDDDDCRFDDDPELVPDDWQDQSLYDDDLLHHVDAPCSPCYSPSCGADSYASSSYYSRSELDDRSSASSGSFPNDDSDFEGGSYASNGQYEYGDY